MKVELRKVSDIKPYDKNPRDNAVAAAQASGEYMGQQGVDAAIRGSNAHATHEKLRPKDRPMANDFVSDAEFARLLRLWFGNIQRIQRVLEPGRSFYIWGGYTNIWNYPHALKESELYFSQMVIWMKEHPVLTRQDFMGNRVVLLRLEGRHGALLQSGGHERHGRRKREEDQPAVDGAPDREARGTCRPRHDLLVAPGRERPRLLRRLREHAHRGGEDGPPGVLDALDPLYCDVIVRRWEEFADRKAERPTAAAVETEA